LEESPGSGQDFGTLIEGKVGYQTVANDQGTPHDLSSFKYAIDHAYVYGFDLQQANNADFDEPSINTHNIAMLIEPNVTGTIRVSTSGSRGAAFEAMLIQGGTAVRSLTVRSEITPTSGRRTTQCNKAVVGCLYWFRSGKHSVC